MPDVTLRTTFIVGFPGETARDLDDLAAFVGDTGFDHVGVFTYSHEEDTRAFVMDDDVPAEVKARPQGRADAPAAAHRPGAQPRRKGEVVSVMVDGPSPDAELVWQGRLAGQAPDIDSVVFLDGADPEVLAPGQVMRARITGARGYDSSRHHSRF